MTRVLVTGGRDYRDCDKVADVLDRLRPTFLIEGGADGADTCAWGWAKRNLPPECRLSIKPNYKKFGRYRAPLLRNQQMLDEGKPDVVVAFPGGSGTADMVRRARRAGVEVIMIK
jgi:hypothetical protein